MRFRANIRIELKNSVNDPQGTAVMNALKTLGFGTVSGVRVGKFITMDITATDYQSALADANQMCEKLLINPVIESFDITLAEA